MSVWSLINEGVDLFENKKFDEAIEKLNQALDEIEDKNSQIQVQNNIHFWLGRCYLEQAKKVKGKESEQLFEQAVEHHQQQLSLAKQLEDKQNNLQEQNNAQYWLGHCYLEQAKKAKGKESEQLFEHAVEHFQQSLEFAKQLEDKQNNLQEQINAQSWLGRCSFEQAMKAEGKEAAKLFEQAVEHQQRRLELAKQLADEQNSLQGQNYAQSWLGRCYLEQAMQAEGEDSERLFEQAVKHYRQQLRLAHYTSPSVCERLFGIVSDKTNDKADNNDPVDNNKVSPMRIGSSTYMNDPTEGEGLLELLNLQDLELENKADCPVHNAFFTCFSSRVNDLNQFRLYGKENGVEASGCCLVFNKEGNWLKESDVSASFRSMVKKGGDGYSDEQLVEADIPNSDFEDDNLPLYQVAYIAYYDEYIAKEKCTIWLPDARRPKFGIRLPEQHAIVKIQNPSKAV